MVEVFIALDKFEEVLDSLRIAKGFLQWFGKFGLIAARLLFLFNW